MDNYSFQKGYGKIQHGDAPKVKAEIMLVLNITSRPAWLRRINGITIPTVKEVEDVESVFLKYGVKKSNVWGS